ncbi:MAG: hypothetical protein ABUL55_01765 [Pseudomonadota bacterium]
MTALSIRRKEVNDAARRGQIGALFRDAALLQFPSGLWRRSKAVYELDGGNAVQIIDEFGEPTQYALAKYTKPQEALTPPRLLYRLVNKNQLKLERNEITQLSPQSWTANFLVLSELYEAVQDARMSATPGPESAAFAATGHYLAALIQHNVDQAERQDRIRRASVLFDQLPHAIGQCLVVLDSELGSKREPIFVFKGGHHPKELNHGAPWRCYVGRDQLDNVLNTFLAPAVFSGFDIYGRPVAGEFIADRLKQYAVVTIDTATTSAVAADYGEMKEALLESIDRAKEHADNWIEFAGGAPRDGVCRHFRRELEFLFAYYSAKYKEYFVRGDHLLKAVYDVEFRGNEPTCLGEFAMSEKPIWESGSSLSSGKMIKHWYHPRFCGPGL